MKNKAKEQPVLGVLWVSKGYHNILAVALEAKGQTQKQAAEELCISMATFWRMLRLKYIPNFDSNWGMELSERLVRWCGFSGKQLYPERYITKEFILDPKVHEEVLSFEEEAWRAKKNRKIILFSSIQPKLQKRRKRKAA